MDVRLERAKARLDTLQWWPRPVRIDHVRLFTAPWAFRLPWLSRFDGWASHRIILLRQADASDDLVTHELCHVWQMQHRPLRMPLSYLRSGYAANGYERQARAAVAATWSAQAGETGSPTVTTPGRTTSPHTPNGSGSPVGTSPR